MADRGEADVALLQEAGNPPDDLEGMAHYENEVFWDQSLYDRWPLVVQLSDRVEVEWFRQVRPTSEVGEDEIGVSGIGTIAAARIMPRGQPEKTFVAVSMYARWMKDHPSTRTRWIHADGSAHRILSDLQPLIDYNNPTRHRILVAGDLNMFYGSTGGRLSVP